MTQAEQTRQRLLLGDTVITADTEGGAVLLEAEAGTYFGLDEIGTRIWHLVGAGKSDDEIVASLLEEYDVEASVLRHDLARFYRMLEERGLVKDADAGSPQPS
ncbi:MAG: PqqD family protein [Gemmatimonadaceae bacterium]|nr:PqqD family protein [Gemmatimonadaceae bacterium]